MPEMRAETIREARRKGIAGSEDVGDPYDLTSMSQPMDAPPPEGASETAKEAAGERAATARAERLRSGRHLERGETGGPS